jgi:hypothetical protein
MKQVESLTTCDGIRNGKECREEGKNRLVLKYVNLPGYFCDLCATDLLKSGLAEEVEKGVDVPPAREGHLVTNRGGGELHGT